MALGPLPLVPGGIKLRLIYDWNSRPAVSVMNIKYTGTTPDVAALTTFASSIATAWDTNLKALFLNTITRKYIEVTDLSSRTGATFTNTIGSLGTKTPGAVMPASAACVVSWKINYRYRGGHPRTYHFGINNADAVSPLQWTSTFITSVTNGYRAFFTAINALSIGGQPARLAMLSYFTHDSNHHPIYLPTPQLYEISDCVVHSRIDSMRTRLGKETT